MESRKEKMGLVLNISKDEAIVLFEWVSKFNEEDRTSLFEDQSEQRVLFDLEAELEKVVSEVFNDDYNRILLEARERIRDKEAPE